MNSDNPQKVYQSGITTATLRLNVRSQPNMASNIVGAVNPGIQLAYDGYSLEGEKISGNSKWYFTREGNWFWSGEAETQSINPIQSPAIINQQQWHLEKFHIPDLWSIAKGSGIGVALLDSGIGKNYALDSAVKLKNDAASNNGNTDDLTGHGTHCAGIISARTNPNSVLGVAPESDLYLYKVRNDEIDIQEKFLSDALDLAGENDDISIVNLSLEIYTATDKLYKSVQKALTANKILIAAADIAAEYGYSTLGYPAFYPECIRVGFAKLDSENVIIDDDTLSCIQSVDIVAPGRNIYSTKPNDTFASESGSSMATAFTSGVAALLIEKMKKLNRVPTQSLIKEILTDSCDDIKTPDGSSVYKKLINPQKALSLIN